MAATFATQAFATQAARLNLGLKIAADVFDFMSKA